jgi:hypothetical protein
MFMKGFLRHKQSIIVLLRVLLRILTRCLLLLVDGARKEAAGV